MTALGFLLGEPMFARDFPRFCPFSLDPVVWVVHWIGIVLFFLSMWFMLSSMWTYYRKYRHVLFDLPAALAPRLAEGSPLARVRGRRL